MPPVTYDPVTNEFRHEAGKASILPQLMWHVTDRCPLACPYCFATKTGADMDMARLDETLSMLKQLGVQKVDIAGGEPLIWEGLPTLVEALALSSFAVTITSSGVASRMNRQWIVEHAERFARIIVSVDGGTPEAHDQLRNFDGAFACAADLVNDLHNRGYGSVRINTVLVRSTTNYSRLIQSIAQLHPREWCIIQPHPANQKPKFDSYSVDTPTFLTAVEQIQVLVHDGSWPVGRIITRSAANYTGYWVLYPDGVLKQHTNASEDRAAVSLIDTPIDQVVALIGQHGVSIPLR